MHREQLTIPFLGHSVVSGGGTETEQEITREVTNIEVNQRLRSWNAKHVTELSKSVRENCRKQCKRQLPKTQILEKESVPKSVKCGEISLRRVILYPIGSDESNIGSIDQTTTERSLPWIANLVILMALSNGSNPLQNRLQSLYGYFRGLWVFPLCGGTVSNKPRHWPLLRIRQPHKRHCSRLPCISDVECVVWFRVGCMIKLKKQNILRIVCQQSDISQLVVEHLSCPTPACVLQQTFEGCSFGFKFVDCCFLRRRFYSNLLATGQGTRRIIQLHPRVRNKSNLIAKVIRGNTHRARAKQ